MPDKMAAVWARRQISITMALGQCVMAVLYLFPGTLAPARPTTTRIVLELARIGPVWVIWFGVTGIALIVALCTHKLIHVAHAAVGSSWLGFTFALVLSAVVNHGTYLLPVATMLLGVVNLSLAGGYSIHVGRKELR